MRWTSEAPGWTVSSLLSGVLRPLTVDEVVALTPMEMVQRSALVKWSHQYLVNQALAIRNKEWSELMMECLLAPRVTFMEMYRLPEARADIRNRLAEFGYMLAGDDASYLMPDGFDHPQPYVTAPSSHWDFYNAHPGGLAVTVAFNCRMAELHQDAYRQQFGIPVDRDLAVAALCVHEYPKTWLYAWQPNGSWLDEPRTIDQDTWHAHCIYAVAEMFYRGVDNGMVMAVAAAHQISQLNAAMDGKSVVADWTGPAQVVKFLRAGALLAGVDPVEKGLLKISHGEYHLDVQPLEMWVTHLSDMNWTYTMSAAHRVTESLIAEYCRSELNVGAQDGTSYNQVRNYVWSQVGQIPLYEAVVRNGRDFGLGLMKALVVP